MKKKLFWVEIAALGVLAGFANGFLGSAGGIIVLSGFVLLGMEQKHAHASSLLVIAPMSIVSVLVYQGAGYLQWEDSIGLLIGATAGGIAGAFFLEKINKKLLEWIFTGLILFTGARMLF